MRRIVDAPSPPAPAVPDGWFSIHTGATPTQPAAAKPHARHDGLGLARGINAANIRVPRLQTNEQTSSGGDEPRASPRHRRLQQQKDHAATMAVADAFAPNRSLRLARLRPARLEEESVGSGPQLQSHQHQQQSCHDNDAETSPRRSPRQRVKAAPGMSSRSRAARFRESRAPPIVPLHEAVRGFDDAVDASPRAESNQAAVTELFAAAWMDRFERERGLYKSIVLHAEVAFRELYRLTAHVASPNDVVTAFACKIFDDMAEHFGPYATIVHVLSSELGQSIYAPRAGAASPLPPAPPLPYYAIVKNQKRILVSLRKDQLRRQERNDFLRYEIDKVHETLLHFLDQCGVGLVRTIFREWYSVAVVSKRNAKKYIEYFSAWFGGSVKAMVPRLFLAWKSLAVETRVARLQEQLASDQAKLAGVQKAIEELTVQRDLAQLESLAIRNDRRHAEDAIQRLHRKIQSASAFLEDSPRREALVGHEGQLRVEAATFLPPLVLESLLRGFHNVGFLQPVHSEFAPCHTPEPTVSSPKQGLQGATGAVEGSVLQQCVTALQAASGAEIPLYDCLNYVHGIRVRVEGDATAHMLFLPKSELAGVTPPLAGAHSNAVHEGEPSDAATAAEQPHQHHHDAPLGLQELVRHFHLALRNVHHQDEHYARHPKLFSSRMLEQSEISVVPHAAVPPPPASPTMTTSHRVAFSSIDHARVAGSTSARLALHEDAAPVALDELPLLAARDLELSPQHTRAFVLLALGQLLLEYGSLLFSPTDLSAFVRNRVLHKVMFRGIAGGKHTLKKIHVPVAVAAPSSDGNSDDDSDDSEDDDGDAENGDGDHVSSLAAPREPKRAPAKGMMMLHKQTTQRRIQVVARRVSSYRGLHAPLAREIDQGLMHLKTAYDLWNRLSQQLIQAEIVAAEAGGAVVLPVASVGVAATGAGVVAGAPVDPRASAVLAAAVAPMALPETTPTPITAMRPRLQLHIEPLPGGPLMASAKERDRSDAPLTPTGGRRRSVSTAPATDWSFQHSKLRALSLDDASRLVQAVQGVHAVVRSAGSQRAGQFAAAKRHLRDLRASQWHHACTLASQFTADTNTTAIATATTTTTSGDAASAVGTTEAGGGAAGLSLEDDRRDVFECVTFENEAIARLFSVEDHPEEELQRVRALLERKRHVVRHALYCRHRPGAPHAASLDDLWHVVKVLRLPRDVRVLPALRDDELASGAVSYVHEQLFSPDDVAEVLLQLCNEQFAPHVVPLSARVEHLVVHHLPLAAQQHQSAIREILHKSDVKKALSDHGQTLRTIFRRYCAKEKDLLAAAAAKRRAAVVAATATTSSPSTGGPYATTTTYPTSSTPVSPTVSTTVEAAPPVVPPQGFTKFMRLADWHDFIADYKLLRARFTAEYATVVFSNVQEAESGLEDNLEMIYSEFTEAIVALAVCFFPDPFLRHATRVHQFIRRYLPVSPEEIRDHHL